MTSTADHDDDEMATMDVTPYVTPDEITRYGSQGLVVETNETHHVVWHGFRVIRIPRVDAPVTDDRPRRDWYVRSFTRSGNVVGETFSGYTRTTLVARLRTMRIADALVSITEIGA